MSIRQTAQREEGGDLVLVEDSGAVRRLTLNRPAARNSLSMALMECLLNELEAVGQNPAIHAVVIAADGPAFCAGHDLKEMRANPGREMMEKLFTLCSSLMQAIVNLPKPVIAEVQAMATAAGCQLVASCDLAIAAESARFATPGVNIGLFCSTPMVALSRNVAPKHAMEMLLTGQPISAARAAEIGLINRVVADGELRRAVMDLANGIAAKSPLTLAIGKEAFYRQISMPLKEAYEYTAAVMTKNMMARDAQEGIDAFLAKRRPVWRGE